jgi:hypothetical protein
MLLALEAHEGEFYHPDDDEWAAIQQGLDQAKRGEPYLQTRSPSCLDHDVHDALVYAPRADDLREIVDFIARKIRLPPIG